MTNEKILYAELNLICVVVMVVLSRKLRRTDKSIEQTYLSALLGGLALMILFDMLWALINGVAAIPSGINYLLNILYFTATAVSPYLGLRYLYVVFSGKTFTRRQTPLLLLPAALMLGLALISIRTGWLFSVDAANNYHRGPLFHVQYIIPFSYMIADTDVALHYGYKQPPARHKKAVQLAVFLILPLLGSALELLLPDLTIVCTFLTVAMVSTIFDFQQEKVTKDALTQLSNRRDLLLHLEDALENPVLPDGQALYVMYADIDYFKSINDSFGHLEGDHALCHAADALRLVCRSANAFPARIGGDEFVVVFRADSDRGADSFRSAIKDTVRSAGSNDKYILSVSAGYTRAMSGDKTDPAGLLDRADAQLYEAKKSRPSRESILRAAVPLPDRR
ncbi:MAG: GGDEF domain-containing protein [Oscillospiraceae bacterium]|nr:GGDEF domain-containing protein [Oscillospiraceae bacterium]